VRRSFKNQLERHNINQVPGDYGRCIVPQIAGDKALAKSPGTGPILDPYTLTFYEDTDEGDGDGRLDDCAGRPVNASGSSGDGDSGGDLGGFVQRPDGVPDFYVLNPAWGDIRQLGNQNTAEYEGLTLEFWAGVLAPADTPPEIVGKLNAAINETLRSPEMKDSMAKLGFDAKIGTPQDFAAFIAEEIPRWAEIVKATGVTFE
jgi:hypothetical protein